MPPHPSEQGLKRKHEAQGLQRPLSAWGRRRRHREGGGGYGVWIWGKAQCPRLNVGSWSKRSVWGRPPDLPVSVPSNWPCRLPFCGVLQSPSHSSCSISVSASPDTWGPAGSWLGRPPGGIASLTPVLRPRPHPGFLPRGGKAGRAGTPSPVFSSPSP